MTIGRRTWILIILSPLVALALVPFAYGVTDNRDRKIEVYRAFLEHYAEGSDTSLNLAATAPKFDAGSDAILDCAPTVLATTAVSRWFRTITFRQADFSDMNVRVVDPKTHRIIDPMERMQPGSDVGSAVKAAFDAGLLQVSDIGFGLTGNRALMSVSFSCGMLCGHSGTVLMERQGRSWVLSDKPCGPFAIS